MAQNEPPQDLMKQIGKPRPRGWRRVLRWTVIGLVVAGLGVAVFLQVRRPPTPPTYASTPLARGRSRRDDLGHRGRSAARTPWPWAPRRAGA
jgi:hypothetical protein